MSFLPFMKKKNEDVQADNQPQSQEEGNENSGEVEVKEEEIQETEKEVSPDEVMIMKKGDYSVHVLVEEIKNWITRKGKDRLPYPCIKITCLGKTVRTNKTKLPVAKYYQFDEHFYFSKADLTPEMLDSEKIVIEAYDCSNSSRKDYYGITEFDFEYIYNRKDHALKNFWIALANPESENISEVRGYLKLSISVLHNTDPRVELVSNESSSDCIVPTQIRVTYKQVSLYFFRAEELPNLDDSNKVKRIFSKKSEQHYRDCDGYVEVNYMGITRKTKWVKMERNICVWNQIIDIPVALPVISKKIVLFVRDYDKIGEDDYAGSIELSIEDIFNGKYKDPVYLPIYGAPTNDNKEKFHKMMYHNAEIASTWNGRILMKIETTDVEAPISNIRTITDNSLLAEARNLNMPCIWKIYAKLYDALYLPITGKKKYSIVIQMDQQAKEFENLELTKNSTCDLNINKVVELTINTNSNNISVLPDLFIYFKYDDTNICFQRFKPELLHCNKDVLLVKLMQDPCFKKAPNSMMSGLLRMKLCIHNPETDPVIDNDIKQTLALTALDSTFDLPDPNEVKNSEDDFVKQFTVVCIVHMSKQLIAAEKDGTSDPYVKLTLPKQSQLLTGNGEIIEESRQTRKIMNTTNGIWNEAEIFENVDFVLNVKATWPVFLLQVYDWNRTGDVPIGYSYIWLNDTSYRINDTSRIAPKWHQLSLPQSNKKQGQILLSFYILDELHKNKVNEIKFKPETISYSCEINILGLRQLRPLSLLPVKKPYIKFNMNSLNVTGESKNALQNISTIPSDTGCDPTINTVIKFDIPLPKDMELMPELQCEVYDHLLNGIANSLLGVFNIDLNSAIEITNKAIDSDLRLTSRKIGLFAMKEGINKMFASVQKKEEEQKEKENIKPDFFKNDPLTFINSGKSLEMEKSLNEKKEPLINKNDKDIEIPLVHLNSNNEISTIVNESEFNKVNAIKSVSISNQDLYSLPYDSKIFMLLPRIKKFYLPGYKSEPSSKQENNSNVNNPPNNNLNQNPNINKNEINNENTTNTNENNNSINTNTNENTNDKSDNSNNNEININNENNPPFPNNNNEIPQKEKIQKDFWVEDKLNPPPEDRYFPIGYIIKVDEKYGSWDPKKDRDKITKHYRRKFNLPLENINDPDFIKGSPFDKFPIRRGKYEDKSSETKLFEEMADVNSKIIGKNGPGATMEKKKKKEEEQEEEKKKLEEELKSKTSQSLGYFVSDRDDGQKNYGYFKGIFTLAEKEKMNKYINTTKSYQEKIKLNQPVDISYDFENFNRYEKLRKEILSKKSVVIRIYVLELNNLAKRDLLSESDPYIKIFINNKEEINERKNYQLDEKNCKWYKYYDIVGTMPGASTLRLEVWDYDDLFSDDLIGQTIIDLEDRYFDETWRNLEHKPIELRPLAHPDYMEPQGDAMIWIEIFDTDKREQNLPWNIQPEPSQDYELRFIVWECEGMDLMDTEGTSDLYVIGYIEMKEKQTTDVHFRSQDGNGSFNWRMLLPMHSPNGKTKLNIQVYDKDLFAHDDYICDTTIDLSKLLDISKLTGLPIKLTRDFYNGISQEEKKSYGNFEFLSKEEDPDGIKFYTNCYNKAGVSDNRRVLISVEILPKALADMSKVGKGRDEPNINPYLPPPTGRLECSLNPFKMLRQCVGAKFRRKICCYCIIIILSVALIILIPYWILSKGFGLLKGK